MARRIGRARVVIAWLLVAAGAWQEERDLAGMRAEVNAARADAAVTWEDLQRAAGPDAN